MTENTTSCTEATDESSRRSFLKAGALASGGLALGLSGGSGVAAGHGDENADGKNSLNLADVTFLQMMAYHHRGAVELAGLASERTDREELLEFAEMAIEAQSDEIEQIRTMLRDAGINPGEVLDVDLDTVRGLVSNIPGMFKANELAHLRSLEGTEFDLTFIDIFTYHHRGAIILSKEVLTHGQSPGVEQLANGIIDAQKSQIIRMYRWYLDWA